MRLAVVNLKGGVGKTVTSFYLAHELAKEGKTLLVDADPQQSAFSWSEQAAGRGQELPFDVIPMPSKEIHKRLKTVGEAYTHVVIDSPPGHIEIVQSSLLAADIALIPLSSSLMEIDRMRPALEVIASVENFKPELSVRMLFNRVQRNTNSYRMARQYFEKAGFPVLETIVPRRESYNLAFGARPVNTPEYEDVLHELKGEERKYADLLDGKKPAAPVEVAPSASVAPATATPSASTATVEKTLQAAAPVPPPEVVEVKPAPAAKEDGFDPFADDAPAVVPENAPVVAVVREPAPAPVKAPESEAPRRRADGGSGEMAAFTPAVDPVQRIFAEGDEDARPPHLRR